MAQNAAHATEDREGGIKVKNINRLGTPCFLLDLDKLEQNIQEMANLCQANGKKLCPMVKTHKSGEIAALQAAQGADSFLAGTIDEAEMLVSSGYRSIVFPYPIIGAANIARVMALTQTAQIMVSFDGIEAADQWDKYLQQERRTIEYLVIIDCGLGRLGVLPEQVLSLVQGLQAFSQLNFRGIATHPGQVYGKSTPTEVRSVAEDEIRALQTAHDLLSQAGFSVAVVATGSTPTAPFTAQSPLITTLRPGNYVFYDAIQVALGVVPPQRCSFTILATIIAHPVSDRFIMDAGSKCFGLDKGAHGAQSVTGYGIVKGHPEVWVEGLSEEVGKLRISHPTTLQVGDTIEIIPNHACAAANMTNYVVAHRNGVAERLIAINARGGSKPPLFTSANSSTAK